MTLQRNLQKALVDQFHHPRGVFGSLAGRIMARRESNLERNRWTVGLLDLAPGDHVLELGPGPGVTLSHASVDPSGLMAGRVSSL